MALLELDEIKLHLNIGLEDTTEDSYLAALGAAAEGACEIRTGRWINPTDKPVSSTAADFTVRELELVRHVARLLIGHWYLNREAAAPAGTMQLPMGVQFLLEPLRDFSGR